MAGTKQRDPRIKSRWRKHFRRHERSGMSARDFCVQQGLIESTFHFWRREIARRDRVAIKATHAFAPVTVQSESTPLEIVLASGHVVRVPIDFDAQTFRQLLALLEEPSC